MNESIPIPLVDNLAVDILAGILCQEYRINDLFNRSAKLQES